MPVRVIDTRDVLTEAVKFRTSLAHEMIVSLHTLRIAKHHPELAAAANEALDQAFWAELQALYGPLNEGTILFEFPADCHDTSDVPGFIAYVRDMNPVDFIFYLVGRVINQQQIADCSMEPDAIIALLKIAPCPYYDSDLVNTPLSEILRDVRTFQARLVALWQRYWEVFFLYHVDNLPVHWDKAISEKRKNLTQNGLRNLLELTTGKPDLPAAMPKDRPFTEIVLIPIYYASTHGYLFYGYGNATILFNSETTEGQIADISRGKEHVLEIAKALSDSTRINILQLITRNPGRLNGKRIAARLQLTSSNVSRQLAQLRSSGLIIEEPHEDQTITYRPAMDVIDAIPTKLKDYLAG